MLSMRRAVSGDRDGLRECAGDPRRCEELGLVLEGDAIEVCAELAVMS